MGAPGPRVLRLGALAVLAEFRGAEVDDEGPAAPDARFLVNDLPGAAGAEDPDAANRTADAHGCPLNDRRGFKAAHPWRSFCFA